jgi:4-amino-4-deoxy-L-arabinose transferase-like glycosyltransferase
MVYIGMLRKDKTVIICFLILLAAFAVRFGYILTRPVVPLWPDEFYYLEAAQNLYSGEGYRVHDAPTAYHPVGYSLCLSLLHFAGFNSVFAFQVAQVFAFLLVLFVLYRFCRILFDEKVAFVAIFLGAFYPYWIFTPARLLPTTFVTLFLLLATFFLYKKKVNPSQVNAVLAGFCFGISVLMKSTALIVFMSALVWYFYTSREAIKHRLTAITILITLMVVVLAPWLYRNSLVFGKPLLGTNFGYNLWLGSHADANLHSSVNQRAIPESLQKQLSQALNEAERDRIFLNAALREIARSPGEAFLGFLKKSVYFWRPDPSPTTGKHFHATSLRWISILSVTPLLVFALFGFYSALRKDNFDLYLFVIYIVAFTLVHALFFPKVRFRLPVDIYLFMPAAYFIKHIIQG